MKKITAAIVLMVMLVGIVIFAPLTRGFDFQEAYSDYLFSSENYEKKLEEYRFSRAAYLKSKTLSLQSEAQKATAEMLESRDELVRTHLTAIRLRLVESPGTTDSVKEALFTLIDQEVAWYEGHKSTYLAGDSLDDLVNKSKESESRWETSTLVLIYRVLYTISDGKVTDFRKTQTDLLSNIKEKISQIEQKGDKETTIIQQWFSDIEDRFKKSREQQLQAQEEIADLNPGRSTNKGTYNRSIKTLSLSHNFLIEAGNFLQEIVREVKVAD